MKRAVLIGIAILLLLPGVGCSAREIPPGAASVTFAVHCYDVGAAALAERPGVLRVERGWHGWNEVDRVLYDPRQVSVSQMEQWLKEAGTYEETIRRTEPVAKKEAKP